MLFIRERLPHPALQEADDRIADNRRVFPGWLLRPVLTKPKIQVVSAAGDLISLGKPLTNLSLEIGINERALRDEDFDFRDLLHRSEVGGAMRSLRRNDVFRVDGIIHYPNDVDRVSYVATELGTQVIELVQAYEADV